MARKKQKGNGSGTVYPRKNKQGKVSGYRGSYFDPEGIRRYVSAKTKTEAEKALRQAMADADRGLIFEAENLTVSEYFDRWLIDSVRDTVRSTTFERYEQNSRLHIKPALGRLKLRKLTSAHVRGLYREKLDSGLSPRSVQYIHVTLHKALKQAEADGLLRRNIAGTVKPPQGRKEEIQPLDARQVKDLFEAAKGDRPGGLSVAGERPHLRLRGWGAPR